MGEAPPPGTRELLIILEGNGLVIQHKLQGMIAALIEDCVEWGKDEHTPPQYDLDDGNIERINKLTDAYWNVVKADADRLNSLKPPVNNFFMPDQKEKAKVTPFPFIAGEDIP
jgi:hypothetical protein